MKKNRFFAGTGCFGSARALSNSATALRGSVLEPTLMVVGLNHRTAPLAMRERFWVGEGRRYDVLRQTKKAEGVEEVVLVSSACRTEFFLWAGEPTLAANSLLQFLTSAHGLKLSEWEHFYRLLGDAALAHIFQVASGLDSLVFGEPQIAAHVKSAWDQAQTVGSAGHCLNAVMQAALRVAEQVQHNTATEQIAISGPRAAVEISADFRFGRGAEGSASGRIRNKRIRRPTAHLKRSVGGRSRSIASPCAGTGTGTRRRRSDTG